MAVAERDWVSAAEMCPLDPTDDHIVVDVHDGEAKTPGGLVLPDQSIQKPHRGTVLAVGPGERDGSERLEVGVAVGDTVIFCKYSGAEIEMDGESYLVIRENDVIAKVRTDFEGP